ncbi:Pol Polyprotein, partial [Phytophthora megakarya]
HIFFDCPYADDFWATILLDWGTVIVSPLTWTMICLLEDPTWAPVHTTHLEQLSQLWLTTRSIVLYLLWTSRNKLHFDNQVPLHPSAACYTVRCIRLLEPISGLSSEHPAISLVLDSLHAFSAFLFQLDSGNSFATILVCSASEFPPSI